MIMPILNFNAQNFTGYPVMRAIGVRWSNGVIRDPSGLSAPTSNYARKNGNYNTNLDWLRVLGRGIECFRTSYHYNACIWNVDGTSDGEDLRHNRKTGNWVEMEDIRYNNPNSPFYGKPMQLYATKNDVDPKSGKADEWGNIYDINNWDKQEGVDKSGGSYWFRRLTTYSLFNKGVIQSNGTSFNFQVNKHNLFWPIPNSAITAYRTIVMTILR